MAVYKRSAVNGPGRPRRPRTAYWRSPVVDHGRNTRMDGRSMGGRSVKAPN
jgi:hypothetical protein